MSCAAVQGGMGAICCVLSFALLWWTCYRFLRRRTDCALSAGESLGAALAATIGMFSVLGIVLAFAGQFRPLCIALAVLLALAVMRPRGVPAQPSRERTHRDQWLLPFAWGVILLAGLGLFFRPDENLVGNWDPGVYMATGAHIAREGSWLVPDTASPHLTPEEKNAVYGHRMGRFVKYPGFYVDALRPHTLQPQFFPLYPVWVAFLSLIGNMRAAMYASGLFAWLSLLMLLLAARETGGRLCSVVTGLVFLLNPVQIWFSGFHTAEIAMQFFFLAGVWFWTLWHRTRASFLALLAGGMFGLTAFASVTGIALCAFLATAHLYAVVKRRAGLAFYAPLLLLLPLSIYQNVTMTPEYFTSAVQIVHAVLQGVLRHGVPIAGAAFALAVSLVLAWRPNLRPRLPRHALVAVAGGATAVGLVWLVATLYRGDLDHSRWLAGASMLSKTGILSAFAGLMILAWRRPSLVPMLVIAPLLFAGIFFHKGLMTPIYPWAFKRSLAVTLPVACLFIGCFWATAAGALKHRTFGVAVLLVGALLILRPLRRGHDFAFHRDWNGFTRCLAQVDRLAPEGGIVLARREMATPLEFICGRKVFPVYGNGPAGAPSADLSRVVGRCLDAGIPVCAVRETDDSWDLPFDTKAVGRAELGTLVLDQSKVPFVNRKKTRQLRLVVEVLEQPCD